MEWDSEPLVAVTVTVYVPGLVLSPVNSLRLVLALPPSVSCKWLVPSRACNPLEPPGVTVTDRLTVPVNPELVSVIVTLALSPCWMTTKVRLAAMVKSAVVLGLTVKVTVVV